MDGGGRTSRLAVYDTARVVLSALLQEAKTDDPGGREAVCCYAGALVGNDRMGLRSGGTDQLELIREAMQVIRSGEAQPDGRVWMACRVCHFLSRALLREHERAEQAVRMAARWENAALGHVLAMQLLSDEAEGQRLQLMDEIIAQVLQC